MSTNQIQAILERQDATLAELIDDYHNGGLPLHRYRTMVRLARNVARRHGYTVAAVIDGTWNQ